MDSACCHVGVPWYITNTFNSWVCWLGTNCDYFIYLFLERSQSSLFPNRPLTEHWHIFTHYDEAFHLFLLTGIKIIPFCRAVTCTRQLELPQCQRRRSSTRTDYLACLGSASGVIKTALKWKGRRKRVCVHALRIVFQRRMSHKKRRSMKLRCRN